MKNIKDLFIPYELAVMAKEKGYNENCLAYYGLESKAIFYLAKGGDTVYNAIFKNDPEDIWAAAPLYQQLVDWFGEKHNIHISILHQENKYDYYLGRREPEYYSKYFITYYEALNAALTEAFKLI